MIVVIDGPAGSGKSSTAKAVADRLGIQYLDSGALYRAVTLVYIKSNLNRTTFFDQLKSIKISFRYIDSFFHVYINSEEVSQEIRTMNVSDKVSEVASMPEVRAYVNSLMNDAVKHDEYIADGRDLGTAVFPNAAMKFFMIAELETRAKRRLLELKSQGSNVTLEQILLNISERDQKDSSRKADPLRKADDAIEIDTSSFIFEEQVGFISEKIRPLVKSKTK
ncbi:MAG: (d)CMP kinase [Balneolaceae bacterium]